MHLKSSQNLLHKSEWYPVSFNPNDYFPWSWFASSINNNEELINKLEESLKTVETYSEWVDISKQLDHLKGNCLSLVVLIQIGNELWKGDDSGFFDSNLIRERLNQLK